MKRRRLFVVLIACLVLTAVASPRGLAAEASKTFYVSPTGSDANAGTEAAPFQTLTRARDAVRQVNREMAGDIEVVLRGGTYSLAETLVFDHRDGGTGGHSVIYRAAQGETPILSGGQVITGWQPDAAGRWKATTKIDNFRQLYVDGRRAVRARGGPLGGGELHGDDGYTTKAVEMADWKNPTDIEFCYQVVWAHTRCKVASIRREGDRAVIVMLQPHFTHARQKEGVHVELPDYVENALELLDEPGEWYLDRPAKTVYYLPKPGEDMTKTHVVAPAVERLVELRGTLDQPVGNIQFEGITFAEAGWLRPSEIGLVDVQANFIIDWNNPMKREGGFTVVHNEHVKSPANVVCHAARNVRFERCTFTRLGGAGLDIEHGSQGNVVSGCHFHDIAGSAVQIGDVLRDDHHPDDPRKIVKNNTVVNCRIHHCCVDYMGGVGVFAGYTDGTVIAHNDICDLPYSGVSVGWGWGEEDAGGGNENYYMPFKYDKPTPSGNNRIEFNHIRRVMSQLQDGGGIYTLGNMAGTILRGNHIHDNPGVPGGIYLDEGSGFIEVTGNLVHGATTPMNYNNRAQNRIATCKEHDNFFGDEFAKPPADLPAAAKKVADEAGPEPAYREAKQVVVTFSLGLNQQLYKDSYYGEPPQLAVWLEDLEGKTTKTVWVSHRTGKGDWAGAVDRQFALPYWALRHAKQSKTTGPPTFAQPVADAVTGPTPKETLVEHIRVRAGGEWLYFVEVNVSGDYNEQFPATFKGGAPDPEGNGQPSIVYRGKIRAVAGQQDTPALVGRTEQRDATDRLNPDLSGITTAKSLLTKLEVRCDDAEE